MIKKKKKHEFKKKKKNGNIKANNDNDNFTINGYISAEKVIQLKKNTHTHN